MVKTLVVIIVGVAMPHRFLIHIGIEDLRVLR